MDQRRSQSSPRREPIRHGGLWALMVVIVLAGIPLYLPPGTARPFVLGAPYWMVIAITSAVLFAALTSWMCLRRWNLVEQEEENAERIGAAADESEGGTACKA